MSQMERNSVRAAYIHKAEHLDERRLMLQWWADFLDVNRGGFNSPFEYAKLTNLQNQIAVQKMRTSINGYKYSKVLNVYMKSFLIMEICN